MRLNKTEDKTIKSKKNNARSVKRKEETLENMNFHSQKDYNRAQKKENRQKMRSRKAVEYCVSKEERYELS